MKRTLLFSLLLITLASCTRQKDITLALEERDPKLVAECYLSPGAPIVLFLTKSQAYLAEPTLEFITDAKASITYDGQTIELFYVSGGTEGGFYTTPFFLVPNNPDTSKPFFLSASSGGKSITATCKPVPVPDSILITYKYNDQDKASFIFDGTRFPQKSQLKHYRMTMNYTRHADQIRPAFGGDSTLKFLVDLNSSSDQLLRGSGYDYPKGDSLTFRLYALSPDYYNFLRTADLAYANNGNPFAEPGSVVSNIQGGYGIFAFISYWEKKIYLQ